MNSGHFMVARHAILLIKRDETSDSWPNYGCLIGLLIAVVTTLPRYRAAKGGLSRQILLL